MTAPQQERDAKLKRVAEVQAKLKAVSRAVAHEMRDVVREHGGFEETMDFMVQAQERFETHFNKLPAHELAESLAGLMAGIAVETIGGFTGQPGDVVFVK